MVIAPWVNKQVESVGENWYTRAYSYVYYRGRNVFGRENLYPQVFLAARPISRRTVTLREVYGQSRQAQSILNQQT